MIDYKKRFVEVYEILKHLSQKEFNRIPKDLIDLIRKNRDTNYIWKYDESKKITEQNIPRDTINILAYINTEFILENEKKILMNKIHYFNEAKQEKLKKEKYNKKNMFKSAKK